RGAFPRRGRATRVGRLRRAAPPALPPALRAAPHAVRAPVRLLLPSGEHPRLRDPDVARSLRRAEGARRSPLRGSALVPIELRDRRVLLRGPVRGRPAGASRAYPVPLGARRDVPAP